MGDLDARAGRRRKIANIADRAAGYGFPGVVVDGNDVLAVRDATAEAVDRARAGDGPTLIEAKSYRVDAALGRDQDRSPPTGGARRVAGSRSDPRASRAIWSRSSGSSPPASRRSRQQARRDVAEAVEFALASPRPEPEAALEDVYAPADWLTPGRLS